MATRCSIFRYFIHTDCTYRPPIDQRNWAKTLLTLLKVALLSVLASLLLGETGAGAAENLIDNPGFERGENGQVATWRSIGDVKWVKDEVHSGQRALKVHATGETAKIRSNWFRVPVDARIDVSAWMKAENVVSPGSYYKLRLNLTAYQADRQTKVESWDLVSTEGSFDWKKVQGSVVVPADTQYMHLEAQLTNSSGTFWIDDVVAKVAQTLPAVDLTGIEGPVVLPQPWQMRASQEKLALGTVGIVNIGADKKLQNAIEQYFDATAIPYRFVAGQTPTDTFATLLLLGDGSLPALAARFGQLFPRIKWSDLGDQGYFLSVEKGDPQQRIYLGANSEQGRFYGLQTLKQLVQPDRRGVYVADIIDRPTLERRGIPMGKQWFYEPTEVFERLAELKLNFNWIQGTFVNDKFWYQWRKPLTADEKDEVRSYLEEAQKHFVDVYISIGPRGEDTSHPTYYSSEKEIDLVVEKMKTLYDLGLRNFGLSFDDLQHFGQDKLFGPDVAFFDNDIGAAHAYFINQVYQRLKAEHPDIHFMVVPMEYVRLGNRGDTDEAYLQSLGKLPPEIGFYTSIESLEDTRAALRTTGRLHMVWDNFWTNVHKEQAPEFVMPLYRPTGFSEANIAGYTFMPLIPSREGGSMVSWRTAADYAWAPERYNPGESFQLAAAQYLGVPDGGDGAPSAETPIITPGSGTYFLSVIVTMTMNHPRLGETDVPDAVIRYTIDGTTPTADSPQYRRPLVLASGQAVRVKAKAFREGYSDSGIASAFFRVVTSQSSSTAPSPQAHNGYTLHGGDHSPLAGSVALLGQIVCDTDGLVGELLSPVESIVC